MPKEATIGGTGLKVCFSVFNAAKDPSIDRVIKVAKEFIGEVYFAISDKDEYGSELQALGLDAEADVVVGLYDARGYKYAMTDKFR